MKKYRFFFHYYRQYDEMTVHFRGNCTRVKDVVCSTSCKTKWNSAQPHLVLQGWAKNVRIERGIAYIE